MTLAVVILAGGEGRRIGGRKPLQSLGGQRLIDRAVGFACRWSEILAVAVRDPAQVGKIDAPLITDAADIAGPLAGLAAGLEFARGNGCDHVLAIPADMPFLPADLAARLADAITGHRVAVATSAGQIHPVCALWRSDVLAEIDAYCAQGRRSLWGLAKQAGSIEVDWPTEPFDPFFNVNFSDELREAERLLKQG